jgi:hypothetical protein
MGLVPVVLTTGCSEPEVAVGSLPASAGAIQANRSKDKRLASKDRERIVITFHV